MCFVRNGYDARATIPFGLGGVSYASEFLIATIRSMATDLGVGIHVHCRECGRTTLSKDLEMATSDGARALQKDDQIGSIEAGKKADVTVIDLSSPNTTPTNDVSKQVVSACTPANVWSVVVDGKLVLNHGEFVRLDEDAIVNEARTREGFDAAHVPAAASVTHRETESTGNCLKPRKRMRKNGEE